MNLENRGEGNFMLKDENIINILVTIICIIGFILEIIGERGIKKINDNTVEIIEKLKKRHSDIDKIIVTQPKNKKVLMYIRGKVIRRIDENEKNISFYKLELKNHNKVLKIDTKTINKVISISSLPILILLYITYQLKYFLIYRRVFFLNKEDVLSIVTRDINYLLIFLFLQLY